MKRVELRIISLIERSICDLKKKIKLLINVYFSMVLKKGIKTIIYKIDYALFLTYILNGTYFTVKNFTFDERLL